MRGIHQRDRASARMILIILVVAGFAGTVQAGFDSDFVHKYTELNLGNWGYVAFTFPDSGDRINAFNRSVNFDLPIGRPYEVNADFSTRLNLKYGSNIWQWTDVGGIISARPRSSFFNAGLGFNLGFGRLIAPTDNPYGLWVYESPTGKIIRFYNSFDGEPPVVDVYYSHDSEKLRLKVVSATRVTLEFTDGETHEFRVQEGSWELYKRSDQFGNYQQFSYNYSQNRVTTADNHGRVLWIHFKDDPSGYFPRIIDKVRLPKVGAGVAVYNFNYSTATISTPDEDNSSATPALVAVPLLTNVTDPIGQSILFDYYTYSTLESGRLKSYTNWFGGRVQYFYSEVAMPLVQDPSNLNQTLDHFAADVVGVSKRRSVDVGGTILGEWTFNTTWHGGARNDVPSLSQPTGLISSMTRPDGFTEYRYFKTLIKDIAVSSPEVHTVYKSEYGDPGLTNDWWNSLQTATASSAGTHASSRAKPTYSCVACLDPDPQYDLVQEYEVGGYVKRISYSGRNWAGQAAQEKILDGWTVIRTTSSELISARPAVNAPWIDRGASTITVTDGPHTKITERCFDSLGRVTRVRQVRGTSQSSNDFVREYWYDPWGNLTEARYFGGDAQAVPSGNLCAVNLTVPEVRRFTTWGAGEVQSEGFYGSGGTIALETRVNVIDSNTGLPTSYHSGDELWKTLTYDQDRRLVGSSFPVGLGGQSVTTLVPSAGGSNATRTATLASDDGSTILAQTMATFDGYGRIIESRRLGPGGWATESTEYDAMGRVKTSVNERGGVTQYLNRNYEGRPGIVRPPEGSVHDVVYSYSGDRERTVETSIAKNATAGPSGEQSRTTTTTYDLFGRPSEQTITDDDGEVNTESTTYDLNDHWVTRTNASGTVTNLNQYDAQGFLIVDSHGSQHGYSSVGQPLEEYSEYGDRIDLIYDDATRLIAKRVGGIEYVSFAYAAANGPGEYRNGKLVAATRANPYVQDFYRTLYVTDTFEYKGKGGRVSKRATYIDDPGGFGNITSAESSAVYDDALQPVTVTSPSCTATAAFICPFSGSSQSVTYTRSVGQLAGVAVDGAPVLSSLQYSPAGDVTNYRLGNGLDTELYYSSHLEEPSQAIVRQGGVVRWNSGVASADGRSLIHHYGVSQEIPSDFYEVSSLPTQPTTYKVAPPNESLDVDPLGMVVSATGECEGNYPPCRNVMLYDAYNEVIWTRHHPFTWPRSSTGLELPSHLTLTDVLGRRGSDLVGSGSYTFDSHRWTTYYAKTYNQMAELEILLGAGKGAVARSYQPAYLAISYSHPDWSGSNLGTSTSTGEFTPTPSF